MATIHHHVPYQFHAGERAVQRLLHAPTSRENPTSVGLPHSSAYRISECAICAFGTLDTEGRPWTSVWGGSKDFVHPVAENVLGVDAVVDARWDPVARALLVDGGTDDASTQDRRGKGKGVGELEIGEIVHSAGDGHKGKLFSGVSMDLEARDRVKMGGRFIAGAVVKHVDDESGVEDQQSGEKPEISKPTTAQLQLAFFIEESLGNCPKYINKKDITPHKPSPSLTSNTLPLPSAAIALINKADLIFMTSSSGLSETMDTNNRGGPAGFVRIVSNSESDGVVLVYPEYSGNRLYQTLGNLQTNPKLGVTIPDFETGDVLYMTGETKLLVGEQATDLLPHVKLAMRFEVDEAIFVHDGLSFRGNFVDVSPYTPPLRKLAAEMGPGDPSLDQGKAAIAIAELKGRELLSDTIARFTFSLHPVGRSDGGARSREEVAAPGLAPWAAGQHITLDFSGELDQGYSHMRDNDPQSLNDDFVRTFTISSPPPIIDVRSSASEQAKVAVLPDGAEMQVTVRKHGPATRMLFRRNLRDPLFLPVLGFGGEESFRIPVETNRAIEAIQTSRDSSVEGNSEWPAEAVFVAGGVGITPLLAQAAAVLADDGSSKERRLKVLWSLRAADLPFAITMFKSIPGLAGVTTLFVTTKNLSSRDESNARQAVDLGGSVIRARMRREDVLFTRGDTSHAERKRRYYICTGPAMLKDVVAWLSGQDLVTESFEY
jgi:hypothetical protein